MFRNITCSNWASNTDIYILKKLALESNKSTELLIKQVTIVLSSEVSGPRMAQGELQGSDQVEFRKEVFKKKKYHYLTKLPSRVSGLYYLSLLNDGLLYSLSLLNYGENWDRMN